ncbi:MAG: hypothetical protein KIT09_29255 [Bryobacteraceae bacterium]|nr:hypothetical protein [Bryobacteraceae bacterium]
MTMNARTLLTYLVLLFLLSGSLSALGAQPPAADEARLTKVKQAALDIPLGSPVEVRTHGDKVRGRLTGVADEGVTLQTVSGGRIESRLLPFTDISNVKIRQKRSPLTMVMGVMTMLATAGAITAAVRR